MGILSWLTRRRPVELDEDDFKEEIRAHLAIATQEKIAEGIDKKDAHYAALKEFSVLFGVSATDAVSFARALALVLGVVVVATIVPAWRAARTDPLSALRHQ
jgi:ABC-type lipoprotein release transport system permease subunit